MKRYRLNLIISVIWLVIFIINFISKSMILGILSMSIAITFGSLSIQYKKRNI